MKVIAPRVHLNGDRATDLLQPFEEAYRAINIAAEALQKTCPNARNYYVISDSAFSRAVNEHEARMNHLNTVKTELLAIYEAVQRNEIEGEVL